ncbi:hypothetical protein B0H10DRAFT_2325309, partial [Mycena sp. CBHHK59/15]
AQWSAAWEASPRHEKFSRLDKDASVHSYHKPLVDLSRRNSSLIVQLRTQMFSLEYVIYHSPRQWCKIHRAESPLCQTCQRREDVSHFLFFCSRFHHHHVPLRTALGRRANSIGFLLTTDKGIRHILHYIHATNHLPIYRDLAPPEPTS